MKQLLTIQQELKAPKSQYNKFGKYNYRNLEDILEAVKPLLKARECTLVLSDLIENIGSKNYVKATAKLYDTKDGKEIASNTAYAREAESQKGMNDSQLTGSTSSYARKYALNGLFAIDDNKDSDATNKHDQSESTRDFQKEIADIKSEDEMKGYWALLSESERKIATPLLSKRKLELEKWKYMMN